MTYGIDLDRLKQDISIVEMARLLGLEVRGKQARCYNSPAHKHNDRRFSMGLDTRRNRYKCFACGEQGSVIDLYAQVKGIEFSQAVQELAEMKGWARSYKPNRTNNKAPLRQTQGSEDLEIYSDIYEEFYCVCRGLDKESREYLTGPKRGLTEETLSRFLLFSVSDYEKANQHLKAKFDKDELHRSGLMNEEGNLIFYKHKIIIPFIRDGRIVYLRGRYLYGGSDETCGAKMLGLRGRPAKRLFGYDWLAGVKKGSKVYICEGEFDAMMLMQNGYNAVGILGVNNFNEADIELFRGFEVVFALDNDQAGEQATKELARMFLLKGQAVKTKRLPKGVKDITEFFINKGVQNGQF